MPLTPREQEVVDAIANARNELVELASTLIAFDTTARHPGEPARDEAKLQGHLAERLAVAGAEIDLFEPDAAALAGKPLVPEGLDFAGRPQLVARFPGAGGGPSLLLNGHVDAVPYEPLDAWTSHPLRAEIRDGKLYGRGACDMKGGLAAMTVATEALARLGCRLAGELIVATNTDEESSGAGGLALVERGLRADAGIVTEATGFDVWVACRGSAYATVTVPGRPGHAETAQPHWRDGGAVNAIEKATIVVDALRRLREEWHDRSDLRHPHVSVPDVVPTTIEAGEWEVTYPASCRMTVATLYAPQQIDADGWGTDVQREVTDWILRATAADPWLAEHPPGIEWRTPVMPMEISPEEPIVGLTVAAATDLGLAPKLSGLDSWYDGATFTLLAGTPSIGFGPAGFDPNGFHVAHTIDEFVPVDDLVACAQALAVVALRFCKEVHA